MVINCVLRTAERSTQTLCRSVSSLELLNYYLALAMKSVSKQEPHLFGPPETVNLPFLLRNKHLVPYFQEVLLYFHSIQYIYIIYCAKLTKSYQIFFFKIYDFQESKEGKIKMRRALCVNFIESTPQLNCLLHQIEHATVCPSSLVQCSQYTQYMKSDKTSRSIFPIFTDCHAFLNFKLSQNIGMGIITKAICC